MVKSSENDVILKTRAFRTITFKYQYHSLVRPPSLRSSAFLPREIHVMKSEPYFTGAVFPGRRSLGEGGSSPKIRDSLIDNPSAALYIISVYVFGEGLVASAFGLQPFACLSLIDKDKDFG
jgi:hypothetical protein